jgi:hypothetical protein
MMGDADQPAFQMFVPMVLVPFKVATALLILPPTYYCQIVGRPSGRPPPPAWYVRRQAGSETPGVRLID